MDLESLMRRFFSAGYTMDESGELKGTQSDFYTMAAQTEMQDKIDLEQKDPWRNDWENSF
jgi:hypothetical protein